MRWSLLSEQSWLRLRKACSSCLPAFSLHLNAASERDNHRVVSVANSPRSDSRGQKRVDVVRWDC